MTLSKTSRNLLMAVAVFSLLVPNGIYLQAALTRPELNQAAMENPISLAFMIEAIVLLVLFLWYVYHSTRSWGQVIKYLFLSFAGSLAFSFPLFLYMNSRKSK